jgi:hypothetical protein
MTATITITPSGDLADYPKLRFIEALTSAIGETFEEVFGLRSTRLMAEFAPGDTQAQVESTLGFPAAGTVWISGLAHTYTATTDGTLEGVAAVTPNVLTLPAFADVTLDPASVEPGDDTAFLADLDKAFRAKVPALSEGRWLRRNMEKFGLPIPGGWDEDSARQALQAAVYVPRARRPVLAAFCEGLFQHVATDVSCTVSTANPTRITASSGTPFDDDGDVGRWVKIDGTYRVIVNVGGGGAWAELAPYGAGPYPVAATWCTANGTKTVTVLAFALEEAADRPCVVTLKLWEAFSAAPPTYMQPATTWILWSFGGGTFTVGNTIRGGLSLATARIINVEDFGGGTEGALQLADVVGTFQDNETFTETTGSSFGYGNVNGTRGDHLLAYDGETGGGFSVGNTVVGATSGATGTLRGLQDDGTTGWLVLEYTGTAGSGAFWTDNENLQVSAATKGVANGDSRTLERPAGEPDGGGITRDELTSGVGKKPLYLQGDSTQPEVRTLIQTMLLCGTFAEVRRGVG